MSTWIRRKKSVKTKFVDRTIRSASLSRDLRSVSVTRGDGPSKNAGVPAGGIVSDYDETMLRIFNMRQPTNLTGRFPSTVALHAKGKLLENRI